MLYGPVNQALTERVVTKDPSLLKSASQDKLLGSIDEYNLMYIKNGGRKE